MDDKIRVLVTDDERPIREGCHRVLTGKGYDRAPGGKRPNGPGGA